MKARGKRERESMGDKWTKENRKKEKEEIRKIN